MFKLTCPLCLSLIHKCVTTICSHSYCEACLDEYLVFKSTCFVCEAEQAKDWDSLSIRGQPLRQCFAIDTMIAQVLENSTEESLKAQHTV